MKFILYTNSISPHQMPLAHEIVARIGGDNFLYIYTDFQNEERSRMGWSTGSAPWLHWLGESADGYRDELEAAEILLVGGIRPIELLERRAARGFKTFYQTERWFKPIPICFFSFRLRLCLPGPVRMLVPSYHRMAKRFVRLFNESDVCRCLPIGPWARKDFERMGVKADKMIDWGYFVAPSEKKDNSTLQLQFQTTTKTAVSTTAHALRVLWVGRMIAWKRVDTIIKAVAEVAKSGPPITCTLVGNGIKKPELIKLSCKLEKRVLNSAGHLQTSPIYTFKDSVPISQIRSLMRQHDIYVLASNAEEGWGAALNEALEEDMRVLGTYEAGASAALLPETNLFHAGDWRRLAQLLMGNVPAVFIGDWTPARAAGRVLKM